jgi:hypothetical protein
MIFIKHDQNKGSPVGIRMPAGSEIPAHIKSLMDRLGK